ncbi:MAG: ATPase, T2SS/T4P/T4SS family [Ilumatobacter sp.]|uniref:CpaF family protein n=1 Tax=Ilumatobacter sp. TaxID=1967498 RepID=UPI0032968E3C
MTSTEHDLGRPGDAHDLGISPRPAAPLSQPIDLDLVARIREEAAGEISEVRRADAGLETAEISPEDEAARAEPIIWKRLDAYARERTAAAEPVLDLDAEEALFRRVKADLFGLGGFEEFLFDPTVENIFVIGCDRVFVNRSGQVAPDRVAPVAESDEALVELVNRWSSRLGRTERRFDVSNPRVDMRLPGGFRLHAIMEVTSRPTITIRCPHHRKVELDDQIRFGTVDEPMAAFLRAAVRARCNIIVAGGTGTGKTTLLRSLLFEVPAHERIVTIEDTLELGIAAFEEEHPNVVEMETRQANVEGVGELSMMDLTRECLRMSPDRVVLGEVRGAEALYMMKAMSQGNDGSMCTVHANSARGVADRVRGYCAEGLNEIPMSVIDGFYRNAVDLVVHLKVLPDMRRVVSSIVEVQKDSGEGIRYNELFAPRIDGPAVRETPPSEVLSERLSFAGWSPATWSPVG